MEHTGTDVLREEIWNQSKQIGSVNHESLGRSNAGVEFSKKDEIDSQKPKAFMMFYLG